MQSVSVLLDISKVVNFWLGNADVSRTQGVYPRFLYIFRSSLGKVYLCQVSLLEIMHARCKISGRMAFPPPCPLNCEQP